MIRTKTDTPVTAHLMPDWEPGTVGVQYEYEHPDERRAAWLNVAADALHALGTDDAAAVARTIDPDGDDRLTIDELHGIAEGAAARRAVALAAALCSDAGQRAAARQLRAVLDELGSLPGVTR